MYLMTPLLKIIGAISGGLGNRQLGSQKVKII